KMRDRTAARNYSPAAEEFRREHARQRAWGLERRHAEKLRRIHGDSAAVSLGDYAPAPRARHAVEKAGDGRQGPTAGPTRAAESRRASVAQPARPSAVQPARPPAALLVSSAAAEVASVAAAQVARGVAVQPARSAAAQLVGAEVESVAAAQVARGVAVQPAR